MVVHYDCILPPFSCRLLKKSPVVLLRKDMKMLCVLSDVGVNLSESVDISPVAGMMPS